MEQIPLEKHKQKRLKRKVSKLKEKIKAGNIVVRENIQTKKKPKSNGNRTGRGVIYIGHIPHGFYEDELKSFFKQFGTVTRVKLSRSKNTGRSKGYAFVEFLHSEVAKVAAETMDNYYMLNSVLRCKYVPPEKLHPKMFIATITETNYPKLKNQTKERESKNKLKTAPEKGDRRTKVKNKITNLQNTLAKKGIKFNFKGFKE